MICRAGESRIDTSKYSSTHLKADRQDPNAIGPDTSKLLLKKNNLWNFKCFSFAEGRKPKRNWH